MVQLFHRGELVKTHVAAERGKRTDPGDFPEEKIAFYMRTPAWCRKTAEQVGPACVEVIAALAEGGVLFKLRQAPGILGLRDKHTPDRLEAACRKALDAGDPSYRTIKGILALGAEADPVQRPTGDGGAAAFLRGPSLLFADALTMAGPERTGRHPHGDRERWPRRAGGSMTRPLPLQHPHPHPHRSGETHE